MTAAVNLFLTSHVLPHPSVSRSFACSLSHQSRFLYIYSHLDYLKFIWLDRRHGSSDGDRHQQLACRPHGSSQSDNHLAKRIKISKALVVSLLSRGTGATQPPQFHGHRCTPSQPYPSVSTNRAMFATNPKRQSYCSGGMSATSSDVNIVSPGPEWMISCTRRPRRQVHPVLQGIVSKGDIRNCRLGHSCGAF